LHIDNLKKAKVGVRTRTEAEKYLKRKYPKKRLECFDSNEEIYERLSNNKIDALVDDAPISIGFSEKNPRLSISELLPETSSQYAIMLNKDNINLKHRIDEVIDKLESTGFFQQCRKRWFKGQEL
jgi:arginine/lysine/histidine/glutamine transport system substrate-binding/permease protein